MCCAVLCYASSSASGSAKLTRWGWAGGVECLALWVGMEGGREGGMEGWMDAETGGWHLGGCLLARGGEGGMSWLRRGEGFAVGGLDIGGERVSSRKTQPFGEEIDREMGGWDCLFYTSLIVPETLLENIGS